MGPGQRGAIFLAFSVRTARSPVSAQSINHALPGCLPAFCVCSLLYCRSNLTGWTAPNSRPLIGSAHLHGNSSICVVFPHIWSIFLINLLLPAVAATMDGNRFHFCLLFCFLKGPPGLGLFRSAAKAADRHDPCRNCTASYVPQTNATVNHSCSTSLYCFVPAGRTSPALASVETMF
uniref:Putative secreted protein n=2 Tax=Anopheles triannulatus TaxID=58253 RepID=A0A2M4B4D8_9DIPT